MLKQIMEDMKTAMKAGEKQKVSALRLMMAELKNAEKQLGSLEDEQATKVLQTYKKKLSKALSDYEGEKLASLQEEISLVEAYLPKEASEEDVKKAISEVLASTEKRDFGPLMGQVMKKLSNPNGKMVGKLLKESLG